jgi:hypothetical protein
LQVTGTTKEGKDDDVNKGRMRENERERELRINDLDAIQTHNSHLQERGRESCGQMNLNAIPWVALLAG